MARSRVAIGHVISADVERYEAAGTDGPTTFFRPRVTVEYWVDGRRYEATGPVGRGFGYSDPDPAKRYAAAVLRDRRVHVRYDPARPEAGQVAEGLWPFVSLRHKLFIGLAVIVLAALIWFAFTSP